MSEITDKALASIYSSLSSCSPLVRGLAERLRRVERELAALRGNGCPEYATCEEKQCYDCGT